MAKEILKVSLLRQYKEAGRILPIEEQRAMMERVSTLRAEFGGRLLVSVKAHWSGGEIFRYDAEVFPGIEAVQQYTEALEKMSWFRYVDSESFLGTPQILNEPAYENGIFQLQVVRGLKEQAYKKVLDLDALPLVQKDINSNMDKLGGRCILKMACRWSRDDVLAVELLEWPNLDALKKHVGYTDILNWTLMIDQKHYLGTLE